jgi:superfamily II DNA or RNA helicase
MKIYKGISKSRIATDNPKILDGLRKIYSFKIPGYKFTPQYKAGKWDGKKYFIDAQGRFPTGLLGRLLEDLQSINCVPDVYDQFDFDYSINEVFLKSEFTLYDYQESCIENAIKQQRAIIKSPTGSGKTLIMAHLVHKLVGRKMTILFTQKGPLVQTYEYLKNLGISDLGICFGEGFVRGDIMLCTLGSIHKLLDLGHVDSSEVLMIDEAHEFSSGKTALAAINSFPNAGYRFAFTATIPPEPIPLYSLEGAFGPIVETRSTNELIEDGKLTKPIIQIFRVNHISLDTDLKSYQELYEECVVNSLDRNRLITLIVDKIVNNTDPYAPKVLILVKNLEHARILEEMIPGAFKLEGKDSVEDRKKVITSFKSTIEPSVLIGTRIMQTAINIEEITHLINARGLKGEIPTLQGLGRALRKHKTKSKVFIYDFLDKSIPYLEKHSKERIKIYKSEGHEVKVYDK